MALMKRKHISDGALRKNQELKEDLIMQLNPLKEETYHLSLKRDKLSNRFYLMELETKEQLTKHKVMKQCAIVTEYNRTNQCLRVKG